MVKIMNEQGMLQPLNKALLPNLAHIDPDYLRIAINPYADYRIDGCDLIRAVPVPITSAVLGGEVEVATPDGSVKLKVPAGTQPGQKFRIKGRGLPSGTDTRGDFYAEVKVTIPTNLTAKEREHWEQLQHLGAK